MTTERCMDRVLEVMDALNGEATHAAIFFALSSDMTGREIERGIYGAIRDGLLVETGRQPGVGRRYRRVRENGEG